MYITLSVFLSLFTLALTVPTPTNSSSPNTTITPPTRYYLKTRVIDNGNASKNDLYVSSYHTGLLIPLSVFPFPFPLPLPFISHVRCLRRPLH